MKFSAAYNIAAWVVLFIAVVWILFGLRFCSTGMEQITGG